MLPQPCEECIRLHCSCLRGLCWFKGQLSKLRVSEATFCCTDKIWLLLWGSFPLKSGGISHILHVFWSWFLVLAQSTVLTQCWYKIMTQLKTTALSKAQIQVKLATTSAVPLNKDCCDELLAVHKSFTLLALLGDHPFITVQVHLMTCFLPKKNSTRDRKLQTTVKTWEILKTWMWKHTM